MSHLRTLLGAELRAALVGGRLWAILARNAIPAAGVLLAGWPATLVLAFYIVEIWLYLSLRWSVEMALAEAASGSSVSRVLAVAGRRLLVMAPLLGLILALVGWVAVLMVAARWSSLQVLRTDFAAGLLILAVMAAIEVFGFMRRRLDGASGTADELREGAMMYRAACLFLAGIPIFFLVPARYAAEALVLALTVASIWVEGAPRHATRVMGMRRDARKRLFRRVSNPS